MVDMVWGIAAQGKVEAERQKLETKEQEFTVACERFKEAIAEKVWPFARTLRLGHELL